MRVLSTQGADLMDHEVKVRANSRTPVIRGDDIARPDPLATLISEVSKAMGP